MLERLKMKTYDEQGNIITEWDEEAGWFEHGTEQNEFGEWIMNRIYHPYTEEELEQLQLESEKALLYESRRALTAHEVFELFIKAQINSAAFDDKTSLRMMDFHPAFAECIGQEVKQGFRFVYDGKLYKTAQAMTIQEHYPPGTGTESLYIRIELEYTGKAFDPIPYDGNMELYNGLYYIQNGVKYLCTRDTGAAVYHALSDLVGLYMEVAE